MHGKDVNTNSCKKQIKIFPTESACPVGATPTLSEERQFDYIDHIDVIHENLTTARAIIDCISVLTALERMGHKAEPRPDGLLCGHGWADGVTLCDTTMPIVLFHAKELLKDAGQHADSLFQIARKGGK